MKNILKLYKSLFICRLNEFEDRLYDYKPNVGFFGTGEVVYGKGGSGIGVLLERVLSGDIKANVEAIVSNYGLGGVAEKAIEADMQDKFHYMKCFPERNKGEKFSEEDLNKIRVMYEKIVQKYDLDYVFLSGWLKYVIGLKPNKTVNIHPGPTEKPYGGEGMYGMKVHEKVWEDYKAGKINQSCVTMHYVTENFDEGPIIAQIPVNLCTCKSAKDVQKAVNSVEHQIQWMITQLVTSRAIHWNGLDGDDVQIDMEEVNKYNFPDGTGFCEEIDLKNGVSYKQAKKHEYPEWVPDIT